MGFHIRAFLLLLLVATPEISTVGSATALKKPPHYGYSREGIRRDLGGLTERERHDAFRGHMELEETNHGDGENDDNEGGGGEAGHEDWIKTVDGVTQTDATKFARKVVKVFKEKALNHDTEIMKKKELRKRQDLAVETLRGNADAKIKHARGLKKQAAMTSQKTIFMYLGLQMINLYLCSSLDKNPSVLVSIVTFVFSALLNMAIARQMNAILDKRMIKQVQDPFDGQEVGFLFTMFILNSFVLSYNEKNIVPEHQFDFPIITFFMTFIFLGYEIFTKLSGNFTSDTTFRLLLISCILNYITLWLFATLYYIFRVHFNDCDGGCIHVFNDAMYFAVVGHTTMGFGDIVVVDDQAKVLVMAHGFTVFMLFSMGIITYESMPVPQPEATICAVSETNRNKVTVGERIIVTMVADRPVYLSKPGITCNGAKVDMKMTNRMRKACTSKILDKRNFCYLYQGNLTVTAALAGTLDSEHGRAMSCVAQEFYDLEDQKGSAVINPEEEGCVVYISI